MYNDGDYGTVYSSTGFLTYEYRAGKWHKIGHSERKFDDNLTKESHREYMASLPNFAGELTQSDINTTYEGTSISELQAQGDVGAGTINPSDIQNMSFDEAVNYIAEKKYHWKTGQGLTWGRDGVEGTNDDFPDAKWSVIQNQVRSFMPEKQGVDEKEREFAKQDYQQDMYGLSKEAGKVGQQMQQAYGSGQGAGMRSAVGAQKDIAMGAQVAEQDYEKNIYGLEKEADDTYAADVMTWYGGFKGGGKVPKNKNTFTKVLMALPDAKGS